MGCTAAEVVHDPARVLGHFPMLAAFGAGTLRVQRLVLAVAAVELAQPVQHARRAYN